MRRLSLNRSEPATKSGQNIPKNRCRTTIAERMVETLAELPFIGDQVGCLSHDGRVRIAGRRSRLALHKITRRPLRSYVSYGSFRAVPACWRHGRPTSTSGPQPREAK